MAVSSSGLAAGSQSPQGVRQRVRGSAASGRVEHVGYRPALIGVDGEPPRYAQASDWKPVSSYSSRLAESPGRFAGFRVPAGEHQTDPAQPMPVLSIDYDTSLRRFRGDAGKRWHLELVIVRDAAPIRQLDRLDTDLQERRCIKDVAAAENLPFGGFRHREVGRHE